MTLERDGAKLLKWWNAGAPKICGTCCRRFSQAQELIERAAGHGEIVTPTSTSPTYSGDGVGRCDEPNRPGLALDPAPERCGHGCAAG